MSEKISETELRDFESELKARGEAMSDYLLFSEDTTEWTHGISMIVETVTVTHFKTGVERTYNKAQWVADFTFDSAFRQA